MRRFFSFGMLQCLACALLAMGIIVLCAFRVADYDVWWHLKAGEIILEQGIPALDPFAYTREGLPYLATHEWLAQVIFSLLYRVGGSTALIAFRTAVALSIAFLLLSLQLRSAWITAPFILLVSALVRGGYVDRPQLFTFLILVIFLRSAFFLLRAPSKRSERTLLFLLLFLQLLWVNLHGGAAFLGIGIFGLLWLERLRISLRSGCNARQAWRKNIFFGACMASAVAFLFVSPSGTQNITYLWNLFHDQTVTFIQEWQPRGIVPYLTDLWWVWAAALLTLAFARHAPVFSFGMLLAFGVLSRTAFRHEMLFVFVAAATTLAQLRSWPAWQRLQERASCRPFLAFLLSVLLFAAAFSVERRSAAMLFEKYTSWGYGTVEPAAGAWEFLEDEGLMGNLFNTYDLGGYVMYRGYPKRKAFVDGRNIDYGYAFLKRTFDAAQNRDVWDALQQEYGFTLALIHYAPTVETSPMPYAGLLDRHPLWRLVYLDDKVAVYAKDVPEHDKIFAQYGYYLLTPENVVHASILGEVPTEQLPQVEQELLRAIEQRPESIRARLVLARLYMYSGRFQSAEKLLKDAIVAQPHQEKPYELLGVLYMKTEVWSQAAAMLEEAQARTHAGMGAIDPLVLMEAHERAGNLWRARWYHWQQVEDLGGGE